MDSSDKNGAHVRSTFTIQPCIVQGCTGARIADEAVDPPFGICEPHLDQIRADPTTYGIVCMRCRRLVLLVKMPDRPKSANDLTNQILLTRRCANCGGSNAIREFFAWDHGADGEARDNGRGQDSRT